MCVFGVGVPSPSTLREAGTGFSVGQCYMAYLTEGKAVDAGTQHQGQADWRTAASCLPSSGQESLA